jgi:hypothetical protein
MVQLTNILSPVLVYHGVLQKILPVYFKQMVTIEDRPERADDTGTIAYSSNMHRCFGVAGKIETPKLKLEDLNGFISAESLGTSQSDWGWCDDFIDLEGEIKKNGGLLPSCRNCRRKRLELLGVIAPIPIVKKARKQGGNGICHDCTDWKLVDDPRGLLKFPKPPDWPRFFYEDCPVKPVLGREPERTHLGFIQLSFEGMIKSAKYAFYHCSRPEKGKSWTNKACRGYLRTCGINEKHADGILRAAMESKHLHDIDYGSKESIGSFKFPASWTGSLPLKMYIEAIMHQLFLGNAESLLELASKWTSLKESGGISNAAFRREIQPLLQDLRPLQLSWLLAYPFSGKPADYKTGSWVSENWLAFVRLAPVLFGWCYQDLEQGNKNGVKDLARTILSFHALVARVMTHGGVDEDFILETSLHLKEFMSCLRELDVRVRFRTHNADGKDKKGDAWWLKSNFMSLFNLIPMMEELGPPILWWDGGGKGERFIQEIKPHIRKGVREDSLSFFVGLTQKIYRLRATDLLEERYGLTQVRGNNDEGEPIQTLSDAVYSAEANGQLIESSDEEWDPDDSEDAESSEGESSDEVLQETKSKEKPLLFSKAEEEGMSKGSTIYVYRNQQMLEFAIDSMKPIAGILQNEANQLVFYSVFRVPVKQFARLKLVFDDTDGVHFFGLWYSKIKTVAGNAPIVGSFAEIQQDAKMSAVAIPLWYIIGKDKPDSQKYCVITNWWKPRSPGGVYKWPTLDPSLYGNPGVITPEDLRDAQNPENVI